MDICLCDHTVQKLASSLVPRLLECFPAGEGARALPTLVAIGSSGELVVAKLLASMPDDVRGGLKTLTVQVLESGGKISELPTEVAGQQFVVCDSIVNSGKTMGRTRRALLSRGASGVRTLALIVRNGSSIIPNFYSISIDRHDEVFFGGDLYPVRSYKNGCIRLATDRDAEAIIDHGVDFLRSKVGDYLQDVHRGEGWITYLIESTEGKVTGVLHFQQTLHKQKDSVFVDTVAVDKNQRDRGYGGALLSFLEDYCRFNGVHRARLLAVLDKVPMYEGMGWARTGNIKDVEGAKNLVEMEMKYAYNV